jgi:putative transposase
MTKPCSLDLRDRAVALVGAGETVRSVAVTLRVGRFERREMIAALSRDGPRGAEKDGGHRPRVLIGEHRAWLLQRIASGSDMTLRGLVAELAEQGVKVSYRTVWNFVHREKISYKKSVFPTVKSPRRRPPSRALETRSGQD